MSMLLAEATTAVSDKYQGLIWADYVSLSVYFGLMLLMGLYFLRRQKNTEEYFVGSRSMPAWAVGISLFATLLSTISYLAVPGEMIKHGVGVLTGMLSFPMVFLFAGYVIIPIFMRQRITSAYEYLEERFDLPTRLFAVSLFALIRLAWMGLIVFTASFAMVTILGLGVEHTWAVALSLGAIAILYTAMGGIRAVIWTDVVQFIILFGGAIFTIYYVAMTTGTGPAEWWRQATMAAADRAPQPVWSWDPFTRMTLGGIILSQFFWWICTASSDQVAIQRYLSTSSCSAARRSFLVGLVANAVTLGVLALCGIALFSYYRGSLPATPDKVFPHFITHQLPRGVAGLVVAALCAAAMSSLDSGMNSLSTVFTVDFYRRLRKTPLPDVPEAPREDGGQPPPSDTDSPNAAPIVDCATSVHETDRRELGLARWITCLTGCLAVFIAILLSLVPEGKRGNILDVTNQIDSFIIGPLGGLFLTAMFQRRCKGWTAILSALVGMAIGFVMALGHMFTAFGVDALGAPRKCTWMWVMPVTTTLTFVLAAVITWLRCLVASLKTTK